MKRLFQRIYRSAFWVTFIITTMIVVTEFLVMHLIDVFFSIHLFDFESSITGGLIDALILGSLLSPFLYLFVYKPVKLGNKRLSRFIALNPEMSAIMDITGKIHKINSYWSKILGIRDEEILSGPVTRLILPDDRHQFLEQLRAIKPGEVVQPFLTRVRISEDTRILYFEWAIQKDHDALVYASARDVTERVQAEKRIRESEEKHNLIFQTLSEGVALNEIIYDEKGEMIDYRILEVNDAFYRLADFISDIPVVGSLATDLYKMSTPFIREFWENHRKVEHTVVTEMISPISQKYFEISTSPFRDNKFITSFRDITDKKRMSIQLEKNERFLKESQEAAGIASYSYDIQKDIIEGTDIIYRIFNVPPEAFLTMKDWLDLIHPEDRDFMENYALKYVFEEKHDFDQIYRIVNPRDKSVRFVHGLGKVFSSPDGKPQKLQGTILDVTDKKSAEDKIINLAYFDQLTGLPNRIMLNDRFEYVLNLARRNFVNVTVMVLDLDQFKRINDTLGHNIGDSFLKQISVFIRESLREEDVLARQGGDEFIVVLPDTATMGAAIVAAKLMKAISTPCVIEGYDLISTVSIGISIFPQDGETIEVLLRNADTAMYLAKKSGRNTFRYFASGLQANAEHNLRIVNSLHRAILEDQFFLHFQPQHNVDGQIVGAEALIRWNHPELGMLSPGEFISAAEDTGQIVPIGEWVIQKALGHLRDWMDRGIKPLTIAVNLSAVQFRQENLAGRVIQIVSEIDVNPEFLELELTEAITMENPETAVEVINFLSSKGIRMSIDDFGTGYSSLSYLKRFRVYKLKIDKSFVSEIPHDQESAAIVKAIIDMARSLGLHTIAEGVESKVQLDYLKDHGCTEVQGYYYSKPLSAEEFFDYLVRSRSGEL